MYKRGILILFTILLMASIPFTDILTIKSQAAGVGAAGNVPVPETDAPSAVLVEAETGQILYYKDNHTPLHISSANKLMTILVAIENSDVYSYVTVSADSVVMEGSALNLEVGAKYQLIDLLYAVMLTSANDAAVAIAEHVSAGDINKFVSMMNETAGRLNMTNTRFTNPTGLFAEGQYTTASDISLLIKYAMQNSTFSRLFSTTSRPWYGPNDEDKILTSSNQLFWSYDGITGGKTGYNNKEQQTVICTASRTNLKLICVLLDVPEKSMYKDAATLLDYGFDNFWKSTLVHKGEMIKTTELDGNTVRLISQSDIVYVHPIGDNYIKEFSSEAELNPPLKKSIPAGSARYVLKDGTEVNISLYPETEIVPPEDTMTKIRKKVFENKDIFILVAVLISIEVILILFNVGKLLGRLFLFLAGRLGRRRKSE